jgi:hypothetical protein
MKLIKQNAFTALFAVGLALPAFAQTSPLITTPDVLETRLGTLTFDHALPTPQTRQTLYDELDYQRAVQAVLWAEPAINNALFRQAMEVVGTPNLGATLHDKRQQPGHETLTPNQSVIYLYDMINLKDTGPVVYTAPPGPLNAGFFDMWMRPFYDFGSVGPNKGSGDRILLVPPGYQREIPAGYQVANPKTYQVFTITRVSVKEGMTEEQGTQLLQQIETYRLSDAANPPAKTFVLMGDPPNGGVELRMNRPSGLAYWKLLHRIINEETIDERDRIMLGTLAAIGIERGKPFAPDARMEKLLVQAETMGMAMMINESFSPRYIPDGVVKELYPGTKWENIQLMPSMSQEGPNFTYVVNRMIGFYQANAAQLSWDPKDFPPGFGQKYAGVYKDADDDWLKGENNYRLRVPANVPVKDFWALTVYDIQTRALIEAPQHVAEINPNVQKLQSNADGSVDLFFGPDAPEGMESNWIQTIPGRAWFAYFRWYGPTEAYYAKTWQLPDIKLVK